MIRPGGWVVNAALVVGSVGLALAGAEAVLALFPDLGRGGRGAYEMKVTGDVFRYGAGPVNIKLKPSASYRVTTPEYDYTAYTNALGLRDFEFPEEKSPGTYRIVVVGDSVTFGPGVGLDQTFPKRLERKLAADPPLNKTIQVVNAGVPSYSAGQNYLAAREIAAGLDADMVVVAYFANDAMEWPFVAGPDGLPRDYRVSPEQWKAKRPDPPSGPRPAVSIPAWLMRAGAHSRVAARVRDAVSEWQQFRLAGEYAEYKPGDPWLDPFWPLRKPGYASEDLWALHVRIAVQTAHDAKAAGRNFLLVTIPSGVQVNSYEWDWGRSQHQFAAGAVSPDEPSRGVRQALEADGHVAIDALPALREASARTRRMYFPYDGHLTADGHEVVADVLARGIRASLRGRERPAPKSLVSSLVAAHQDAEIRIVRGVAEIVTPPQQYYYAAVAPIKAATTGLRATVQVLEGRVQVGALTETGSGWAAVSEPIPAGPERLVELTFTGIAGGQIVIANAALADGQRARVRIRDLVLAPE